MTTAMILCAGLGTRLRPLTDELPKPLVWLGDRPLLAHIVDALARGGVTRAVVNTHHLPHRFHDGRLSDLALPITFVHEPRILGTAGGVTNAAALLGEGDIVIWNGDILAEVDVAALQAAHAREAAAGALATLAVTWCHPEEARVGQGTVGLGADGSIVRLRGERFGEEVRGADFAAVQVLGAELRARLPAEGCRVGDGYLPALRAGGRIASFRVPWFRDIGTVVEYLEEHRRWLETRPGHVHVGAGAVIAEGVEVVRSVIGAGAVVRGQGALRDVVVWPGAVVEAPLSSAVVTTEGRVARP
jgi:mannose-1-phosphate guanylyltransferase